MGFSILDYDLDEKVKELVIKAISRRARIQAVWFASNFCNNDNIIWLLPMDLSRIIGKYI
jgi:hypothetical protein